MHPLSFSFFIELFIIELSSNDPSSHIPALTPANAQFTNFYTCTIHDTRMHACLSACLAVTTRTFTTHPY